MICYKTMHLVIKILPIFAYKIITKTLSYDYFDDY